MWLNIAQTVIAILLTAAILVQVRGTNAGLAFGGDGAVYRTRRGIEKNLHKITILLALSFLVVGLINSLSA
ncbi:MAG: preprotein translocase subunit SecG [Patescibacteria group bacterium]